jgi:putative chitinase
MLQYALATINAEASRFSPVSEGVKRGTGQEANTTPNGHPFDKYDYRTHLGNNGEGQGALYKGRGFIQLTGKDNYKNYGKAIGHPELIDNPDLATDPTIAGLLFAQYIKDRERKIRGAIDAGDFRSARRQVNGGTNGLNDFTTALQAGRNYLKPPPRINIAGMQPKQLPDVLMQGTGLPPTLGDQ